MKHGKKYIDAAKLIENNKTYDPRTENKGKLKRKEVYYGLFA